MYQAVNQWVVYNQRKLKITQELVKMYVFGLGSYVLFLFLTSHSISLYLHGCLPVSVLCSGSGYLMSAFQSPLDPDKNAISASRNELGRALLFYFLRLDGLN
jgi:hypothetical protein